MITKLSEADALFVLGRHPEITAEMIANPARYVEPGQAMAIHFSDDFTGAVHDYIVTPQYEVYDLTAYDAGGNRIDPEIAQESTLQLWFNAIGEGANETLNPFKMGSITNILLLAAGGYLAWRVLKK